MRESQKESRNKTLNEFREESLDKSRGDESLKETWEKSIKESLIECREIFLKESPKIPIRNHGVFPKETLGGTIEGFREGIGIPDRILNGNSGKISKEIPEKNFELIAENTQQKFH